MDITFISDTHVGFGPGNLFESGGDILIHSGDMLGRGTREELVHELATFQQKYDGLFKHFVFVAGNHDWVWQREPELARAILENFARQMKTKIHYLEDSGVTIDGLEIYGSPWQPEFCNWAFNLPRSGHELKRFWDQIPDSTQILVTHSPPYGLLDACPERMTRRFHSVGCELLLARVQQLKSLKIHNFGHIHESYGMVQLDGKTYINSSIRDGQYYMANKPFRVKI